MKKSITIKPSSPFLDETNLAGDLELKDQQNLYDARLHESPFLNTVALGIIDSDESMEGETGYDEGNDFENEYEVLGDPLDYETYEEEEAEEYEDIDNPFGTIYEEGEYDDIGGLEEELEEYEDTDDPSDVEDGLGGTEQLEFDETDEFVDGETEFDYWEEQEAQDILEEETTVSILQNLTKKIVTVAKEEYQQWDRGKLHEVKQAAKPHLIKYWTIGGRRNRKTALEKIDKRSAWSAAFISYVIYQAGGAPPFRRSGGHYVYISEGKKNRARKDLNKPVWLYKIDEVRPQPGDLICNARCPRKAPGRCGATFDNVDNGTMWATHSDIVVGIHDGYATVIGGNTGDQFGGLKGHTVGMKKVLLDENGYVKLKGIKKLEYFGILRFIDGTDQVISKSGRTKERSIFSLLSSIGISTFSIARLTVDILNALSSGKTDENHLTNIAFYYKYPSLRGQKLKRNDPLAKDWINIRNNVIRPILQRKGSVPVQTAPGKSGPVPSGYVKIKSGSWGGWKGKQSVAATSIPDSLIKDRLDVAIAATAEVETGGSFDKVNLYDRGILSWGIKQWSAHAGSLQGLLSYIQNELNARGQSGLWGKLFPGLSISNRIIVYHGKEYPKTGSNHPLMQLFRGSKDEKYFEEGTVKRWVQIFSLAGRHPLIQQLQFEYAKKELNTLLARKLGDILGYHRKCRSSRGWCRTIKNFSGFTKDNYGLIGTYIENKVKALTLFNGMWTQNKMWAYIYLKRNIDTLGNRYGSFDINKWPASWKNDFEEELEKLFKKSGVACWGTYAINNKTSCKGRTSRTKKILSALSRLKPAGLVT